MRSGASRCLARVSPDQLQELAMQAGVVAELGVEAECQRVPRAHGYRPALVLREHLDTAGVLHQRGPDEHSGKGAALEAPNVDWGLEAVYLPAIAIAADRDVERLEAPLAFAAVSDT